MLVGVRRAHFHELMQLVHRSLHELRASADPFAATADRLAQGTHLLFMDELEVTDVVCALPQAFLCSADSQRVRSS